MGEFWEEVGMMGRGSKPGFSEYLFSYRIESKLISWAFEALQLLGPSYLFSFMSYDQVCDSSC